jgi:ligand-binding sensor domain-containing protein
MAKTVMWFLLSICCAPAFLHARQPLMQWWTVDQGLVSSQVYQVLQDREGFLWCATGNGISRFDGTRFANFGRADGFPDRGAFRMFADSRGRIWFMTFSGRTCYFENGSFHPPSFALTNEFVRWVEEAPGGMLFLTGSGKVIVEETSGKLRTIQVAGEGLIHGCITGGDTLLAATRDGYYLVDCASGNSEKLAVPIQPQRKFVRPFRMADGAILLPADFGFYVFDHRALSFHKISSALMPEQLYSLSEKNKDLWVGTSDGVFNFPGGNISAQNSSRLLTGHTVTSVLKDHEGNYWFSVYNQGICMMPQPRTEVYNRENGLLQEQRIIRVIRAGDKSVYAFASTGEVYRFDSTRAVQTGHLPITVPIIDLMHAYPLADGSTILASGDMFCRMRNGTVGSMDNSMRSQMMYSVFTVSGKSWLRIARHDSILTIEEYDQRTNKKTERFRARPDKRVAATVFTTMTDRDKYGGYWLGSRQGLIYLNADSSVWLAGNEIPALSGAISHLMQDAAGHVWVATLSEGVFCFDGKRLLEHYTTANGLPGNSCNSLYADEQPGIWACTSAGLARIRPGTALPMMVYRCPEMLPGFEAISMCKSGHRVYVATTKGVSAFDERTLLPPVVCPPVHMSQVTVNGRKMEMQNNYRFEAEQHNVDLAFTAINFRKTGDIRYRYHLDGLDTAWLISTVSHVQYRALPPGDYTFSVYALNAAGMMSRTPAVLSFTVLPAYWQTWWFRIIAVVVCVSLLLLLMYLRVRSARRAEEGRRQLLDLRLQALRSQISPHFVFNALNSVQGFIFYHQPEEANRYIVHFARLMRMISDYSAQETIRLQQEIDFLECYVAVEKMRFSDELECSITVDRALDRAACRIPPMILQPVVENAFKHGLPGREGAKRLLIHFSGSGRQLLVTIEDNGTGRQTRAADDEMQHRSLGLANVRQRLLLLQRNAERKNDPVRITDLFAEDGSRAGLRVELFISVPEEIFKNESLCNQPMDHPSPLS